jgi:hypothetical protein
MTEPNPDPVQPAIAPLTTSSGDAVVSPGHPGHDSALSLTAAVVPDSSTEHEDNQNMGSFAEEEGDGIEGGFGDDDNDSTFGGSLIGCDTDTLASYITDYRYENGRRYHSYRDGEYWVISPVYLRVLHF